METVLTLLPARASRGALSERSATARRLARLAGQALIAEAELTPKPGLVDRRGPGAHADLSLALMRRSALAIEPYFLAMARESAGATPSLALRERLGAIGRRAEWAMYAATGGSNSHKGAIWSLGLLVAGAAMDADARASSIARNAGTIASLEDRRVSAGNSHGRLVARKYGVAGARGEAISGFPHVIQLGLPTLRARRLADMSEDVARRDALLAIMAQLADTCVLYRGGPAALLSLQQGAAAVIEAGGCETSAGWQLFQRLDDRLRALRLSPGGSADLLAATLFLDAIERRKTAVPTDQYKLETRYGND